VLTDNTAEHLALTRKIYAMDTILVYENLAERYDKVVNALMEAKPSAAVLNYYTGQSIWSETSSGNLQGLKVNGYSEEVEPNQVVVATAFTEIYNLFHKDDEMVEPDKIENELGARMPKNGFMPTALTELNFPIIREHVSRKYRAVVEGRITQGKPDFIGTWDKLTPARGLFEMFIKERNGKEISGTIEDTYGTASFAGTQHGKEIKFSKRYDPSAHQLGAFSGDIFYEGSTVLSSINGTFRLRISSGEFEMQAFGKENGRYAPMLR
jgi:hypothetical protein